VIPPFAGDKLAAMSKPETVTRPGGGAIAYHALEGAGPGVIFLGGFMSDMTGTKALALEEHCRRRGRAFVRFDYAGHGASSGAFVEGTIGGWRDDALAVLDAVTEGPQILVGSSMGGWLALLVALARPERVAGLIGLAAAADFTQDMMWERYCAEVRQTLERDGVYYQPSAYGDEPYAITRQLIEEGREHLLLRAPIAIDCPVRLIQGMKDPDVPWRTALRIAEKLTSRDVTVTLVKEGDHRLSEPDDLVRLTDMVDAIARKPSR